jgi:hypothetical protein
MVCRRESPGCAPQIRYLMSGFSRRATRITRAIWDTYGVVAGGGLNVNLCIHITWDRTLRPSRAASRVRQNVYRQQPNRGVNGCRVHADEGSHKTQPDCQRSTSAQQPTAKLAGCQIARKTSATLMPQLYTYRWPKPRSFRRRTRMPQIGTGRTGRFPSPGSRSKGGFNGHSSSHRAGGARAGRHYRGCGRRRYRSAGVHAEAIAVLHHCIRGPAWDDVPFHWRSRRSPISGPRPEFPQRRKVSPCKPTNSHGARSVWMEVT